MESYPEPMKPLDGLQGDADGKTEGQTKSGASIQRVTVVLQEILQALMEERLTFTRMGKQVAKQGRWMLQVPSRSRFE